MRRLQTNDFTAENAENAESAEKSKGPMPACLFSALSAFSAVRFFLVPKQEFGNEMKPAPSKSNNSGREPGLVRLTHASRKQIAAVCFTHRTFPHRIVCVYPIIPLFFTPGDLTRGSPQHRVCQSHHGSKATPVRRRPLFSRDTNRDRHLPPLGVPSVSDPRSPACVHAGGRPPPPAARRRAARPIAPFCANDSHGASHDGPRRT
jgi:hypothetical protein